MDHSLNVVSNRLPVVLEREDGNWNLEAGSGGLVQAMLPLLESRGGRWIGWPGTTEPPDSGWRRRLRDYSHDQPFDLVPVHQTPEEHEGFYAGFANRILWPLFHELFERCSFQRNYWETYRNVNEKFAQIVSGAHESGDTTWIHDYHLILVPRYLDPGVREDPFGFFLHIPFPQPETFRRLPWRDEVLEGLLEYDLVGLQTRRDIVSLRRIVEELTDATVESDGSGLRIHSDDNLTTIRVFPIGCDFDEFSDRASTEAVTNELDRLHERIGDFQVLLGVDRLDYTKGLVPRLEAFERALEKYPELQGEVVLYQLVVPSRESVDEYSALKEDLDQIIGRIEGRFSTSGWQPIQYRYCSVDIDELTALYRYAAAAVVTPIRDGMNLVAKEYCAAQVDETGVLILSEFAGAAERLADGAVVINPHDRERLADAIYRGVAMPRSERVSRMRHLRKQIRRTDVYAWADAFLTELGAAGRSGIRGAGR